MTTRSVAFIHTSPAAIAPVAAFFAKSAPEIICTHLLDDGILRLFTAGSDTQVGRRICELLRDAREWYGAEAAVVTCSSVAAATMAEIERDAGIPVVKIDTPMAEAAVALGRRIGVVVTFAPTVEPTTRLLQEAAARAGVEVEIEARVVACAYHALLSGDTDTHDSAVVGEIRRLAADGFDVVVLAQVSTSRVLPVSGGTGTVPVVSSLDTILVRLRQLMS